MPRKVLIVVHQEHSTPGRVGHMLEERGYQLDRRCPNLGDELPGDLSGHDAMVVFGGPQSAMDCHLPGIKAELNWLERHALTSHKPLLGICLGAQQMARVLGAKVGPRGDGIVEIGYKPVRATARGQDFLRGCNTFYQWHSETFEIPSGATHLAENDDFAGQAFRWGEHAWAIEFHPEMTLEMVHRWCSSDKAQWKLTLPGAQSYAEQLEDFKRHAPCTDAWLSDFLDEFLEPGATGNARDDGVDSAKSPQPTPA